MRSSRARAASRCETTGAKEKEIAEAESRRSAAMSRCREILGRIVAAQERVARTRGRSWLPARRPTASRQGHRERELACPLPSRQQQGDSSLFGQIGHDPPGRLSSSTADGRGRCRGPSSTGRSTSEDRFEAGPFVRARRVSSLRRTLRSAEPGATTTSRTGARSGGLVDRQPPAGRLVVPSPRSCGIWTRLPPSCCCSQRRFRLTLPYELFIALRYLRAEAKADLRLADHLHLRGRGRGRGHGADDLARPDERASSRTSRTGSSMEARTSRSSPRRRSDRARRPGRAARSA